MLDGQAKEAIQFYQEVFDAELLFVQTFAESPEEPITDHDDQLIAHSVLKIGNSQLMVADRSPEFPSQKGSQVSICVTIPEVEKTKRIYRALQQGGEIHTPLEKTYFSPAYGVVTDQFGVTFQFFTGNPK